MRYSRTAVMSANKEPFMPQTPHDCDNVVGHGAF
jgi:hypothetical protein